MISIELANKLKEAGLRREPRGLDQIIAEGDKRGYKININAINKTQWFSDVEIWNEEVQELEFVYETDDFDNPAEAAGQAMLWILQQERDAECN